MSRKFKKDEITLFDKIAVDTEFVGGKESVLKKVLYISHIMPDIGVATEEKILFQIELRLREYQEWYHINLIEGCLWYYPQNLECLRRICDFLKITKVSVSSIHITMEIGSSLFFIPRSWKDFEKIMEDIVIQNAPFCSHGSLTELKQTLPPGTIKEDPKETVERLKNIMDFHWAFFKTAYSSKEYVLADTFMTEYIKATKDMIDFLKATGAYHGE